MENQKMPEYPPIGGTAPGRAKYAEHKSSDLCDGCISLSNAEGFCKCFGQP